MGNSTRGRVFVDGRDISQDVRRIRWPRSADMLESHGIVDTSKEFTAGTKDGGQANLEMLWDDGALRSSFLKNEVATIQQFIYAPNLDTLGEEAMVVNDAILATYERTHGSSELVASSGVLTFSQDVNEALFLMPSTAITSGGGQTGQDNGAASSAGLTAWMQVLDITDMASVGVIIQMDTVSNFASPTTSITFASVANGAEPFTVEGTAAGSVERYLRVNPTFGTPGGSPSLSIVVAVLRG